MLTFDANVLFYAVDHRDGDKHKRCQGILRAAAAGSEAFLTLQALGEFCNATARKRVLPRAVALQVVRDWASMFAVHAADAGALDLCLPWWAEERLSYWDALLVATASTGGATAMISEDLQDGAVVGGVEIISPFVKDVAARVAVHGLKLAEA